MIQVQMLRRTTAEYYFSVAQLQRVLALIAPAFGDDSMHAEVSGPGAAPLIHAAIGRQLAAVPQEFRVLRCTIISWPLPSCSVRMTAPSKCWMKIMTWMKRHPNHKRHPRLAGHHDALLAAHGHRAPLLPRAAPRVDPRGQGAREPVESQLRFS
jgi:hypothetical protein